MSFFLKGKSGKIERKKYATNKKYQTNKKKRKIASVEKPDKVSSDEDDVVNDIALNDRSASEEEVETPQEKKLRLAKLYLEEIEREERKRVENDNELSGPENGDIVSKRLKLDYLKQAGKLKLSVASQYTGPDISNIRILKCKEQRSTMTCLCLTTDDNFIFSGSKVGSIVKWSIKDYKKVASLPFVKKSLASASKEVLGHSKQIMCIAVSSDDKILVVGDTGNDIQVWNANDLKHMGTLKGHRGAVTGVTLRKNTHTLYSCSKDRSVKVWSLDEMSYVETLYGHQDGITAISSLSRERAITSGGRDCSIRIWKIAEESQLIYNGHSGSIDTVCLINEENFISGGDDGQICIWSSMKKKPLCSAKAAHDSDLLTGLPLWITSVASLLNTDLVASGSYNGVIKLWRLGDSFRSIQLLFTIEVTGFVNDLSFTANGKYLIAGLGSEHKFGRWNIFKNVRSSIIIIPLLKLL